MFSPAVVTAALGYRPRRTSTFGFLSNIQPSEELRFWSLSKLFLIAEQGDAKA
jgi:hypothetical protein